jgi:hypothetical protein
MTMKAEHEWPEGKTTAPRFLRENALTLVATALFLASLVGQVLTGHASYESDAAEHGLASLSLARYLQSGHFIEAVFENWESEFLQMAVFVVLTKVLRQKGSSESKKLDQSEEVDEDPRKRRAAPNVPWPVRKGGVVLAVYERSLSLALVLLFVLSFALHAVGGARAYNEEEVPHGKSRVGALEYMKTSRFWFESFQNWQSEFLSVATLVVLSIVLRERGSPQSKPVASPHGETGD